MFIHGRRTWQHPHLPQSGSVSPGTGLPVQYRDRGVLSVRDTYGPSRRPLEVVGEARHFTRCHVQVPSSASRAARWPASTAPSIYPLQAFAVSVAAHLIGPIGLLSAAPKCSRPHGPVFEL